MGHECGQCAISVGRDDIVDIYWEDLCVRVCVRAGLSVCAQSIYNNVHCARERTLPVNARARVKSMVQKEEGKECMERGAV